MLDFIRLLTTRFYIKGFYKILWLFRNIIAHKQSIFLVNSNVRLHLNRNHYYEWMFASTDYYAFGVRKIIQDYLKPGDIFVDVGCNIGYISLIASSIVGNDGLVISFDPDPRALKKIRENIKLNTVNNIVSIGKACSDSLGNMRFNVASHCGWSTAVNDTTNLPIENTIEVEQTTLDIEIQKISENKSPKLIKIDAEGYEPYVVGGATSLISKNETAFIVEINNMRLQGNSNSILNILNKFDLNQYHAYWIYEKRKLFNSLNDVYLKKINRLNDQLGKDGDIFIVPARFTHHPIFRS